MKRKIIWVIVSCLMVVTLLLGSCQSAAPEEKEGTTVTGKVIEKKAVGDVEEKDVEEKKEEGEDVVAPPTGEPIYGGTLKPFTFSQAGGGPPSWDLGKWTNEAHAYMSFYLESLVMGDFDKGPSGTNVWPMHVNVWISAEVVTGSLAESWEIPDPLHYVFHLRKGVRWHNKPPVNGREFVAEDVVYSFNRTKEIRWPRHYFIESITAPDKYTVIIETNKAMAFWGYEFGWGPYMMVYPPEVVEAGIDDWRNACGTGPFMLADYVSGASVTYKRNPDYWGTWTKDGKEYKLPFLDEIILPVIPDVATRVAALQAGKLDLYQWVPVEFTDIIERARPEIRSKSIATGGCQNMAFNNTRAPFNDIRVRRALSMAVDRDAIGKAIYLGDYDLYGYPITKEYGPSLYTPLEECPPEVRELFEYNPEKAKQLLTEAGYPDGFKTSTILMPTSEDLVSMVVDYWADIGVECEMETMELAVFYSTMFDRDYDICNYGLTARPQAFNDHTPEAPWNAALLDDDYYNETWKKANSTIDTKERNAILKDLMTYYRGLSSILHLPSSYTHTYWWPWVKNYNGEVSFGSNKHQYFQYTWVDEAMRKDMGY